MYPTLVNYIEAIGTLEGRLKHLKIKHPNTHSDGTLRYRNKGGMVFFSVVDVEGMTVMLGVFLNRAARERFAPNVADKVYPCEFYVHSNNCKGNYYDVVLRGGTDEKIPNCNEHNDTIKSQRPLCEDRRAFCDDNGKWGYEDANQIVVVKPKWEWVDDFVEGRAVVQMKNLYGIIDKLGNIVVPTEYDELSWDNSRYAYADKNGCWGVIDRQGQIVVDFLWDWVAEFHAGYAIVQKQDKYGFVNSNGQIIIQPRYDDATSFNEHGVARVTLGEQQFFIDSKERRV